MLMVIILHITPAEKQLLVYDMEKVKKAGIDFSRYDEVVEIDGDETAILGSVWDDINFPRHHAKERTGYPTQKPIKLYQRIITASSNVKDIVLDPFAGSGTTLDAAQSLGRRWIGIEQNPEAINIIKRRINDQYGFLANYEVEEVNHD